MKYIILLGIVVTLIISVNTVQSFSGQCEKATFEVVRKNTKRPVIAEAIICKEQGVWKIK